MRGRPQRACISSVAIASLLAAGVSLAQDVEPVRPRLPAPGEDRLRAERIRRQLPEKSDPKLAPAGTQTAPTLRKQSDAQPGFESQSAGPAAPQVRHRIVLESVGQYAPDTSVWVRARNPGPFPTPAAKVRVTCCKVQPDGGCIAQTTGALGTPTPFGAYAACDNGPPQAGVLRDVPPLAAGASASIYHIDPTASAPPLPVQPPVQPQVEGDPRWTFAPEGIAGAPLVLE